MAVTILYCADKLQRQYGGAAGRACLSHAVFSYNYAKLSKQVLNFDDDLNWIYPEQSVVAQSIMIEISALLPLRGGISFQAGYGYMHNFVALDSSPVIHEGGHYLILSTKKTEF